MTGEGRLDATSLVGKVVGHVLGAARAVAIPVALVVGDAEPSAVPDGVRCLTLVELAGSGEAAQRDAARFAAEAAGTLARG